MNVDFKELLDYGGVATVVVLMASVPALLAGMALTGEGYAPGFVGLKTGLATLAIGLGASVAFVVAVFGWLVVSGFVLKRVEAWAKYLAGGDEE